MNRQIFIWFKYNIIYDKVPQYHNQLMHCLICNYHAKILIVNHGYRIPYTIHIVCNTPLPFHRVSVTFNGIVKLVHLGTIYMTRFIRSGYWQSRFYVSWLNRDPLFVGPPTSIIPTASFRNNFSGKARRQLLSTGSRTISARAMVRQLSTTVLSIVNWRRRG